ncbi:MAG TPA: hypothetical protein VH110_03280 [Candidatus Acidoferrum sp.]|jgi:hypothetical protein|nr:hypothetical protein [Candidatus Acidoferrum sp.]
MFLPKASRRDSLKVTGEGVAGTALGVTASSYARIIGANDRVGVGIVGFSHRTRSSPIPSFLKVARGLNFEFAALSDIRNRRRDEGAAYIAKLSGKQVTLATQAASAATTAADTGADDMTVANVRNWLECIYSRKTTNAHIDAGYSHSVALSMTIAAIQTGPRITFDDAKQQVIVGGHR